MSSLGGSYQTHAETGVKRGQESRQSSQFTKDASQFQRYLHKQFPGKNVRLGEKQGKKKKNQSRNQAHPAFSNVSSLWSEKNHRYFQLLAKYRNQGLCPKLPDQFLSPVLITGKGVPS